MSETDDKVLVEKVRGLEEKRETTERENTAAILNERRELSGPLSDESARRQMSKYSRRGFIVGGASGLIGIFGWRWMPDETKYRILRRTLEFNEKVSQVFFRPSRLAPEFPPSRISESRINGGIGLSDEFDPSTWTLSVGGLFGRNNDLILRLEDIQSLPRTEMITELKCIEGWSIIVQWAGVKFSDFAAKYLPATKSGGKPDLANRPGDLLPYVSMSTPDNEYFVGWDIESTLHPQTLLAYEMNGAPLSLEHGAPLRLASPTKYGIKQIKRIGRIEFTADRPRDYWAEEGYDWYAGH